MAKFKVGDKVNCAEYGNGVISRIVTSVMPEIPYYVVFESGKELYLGADRLTLLITREFIVIHRDGNVMTAEHRVNREVIKSAKATCSENDTFDLMVGAQIAFDKLTGRYVKPQKEPKPAPKPAHRFKVGDRVVDDNFGTGTIFEMDDVILEDIPYHVRFSDRIMWLGDKDLTPAPDPEPPKFYTGKVVMVDCEFPDRKHLINHLFEFKDGRQVGNKMHGMSFNHAPYTSFEQIVSTHNASTWIEIKE